MEPKNGRMDLLKLILAVALPCVGAVLGYGKLQANVTNLEDRVSAVERTIEKHEEQADSAAKDFRDALGKLQLNVVRLCQKLRTECKE